MRYFKKDTTLYASEFPPKNMDGVIEINDIEYQALLSLQEERLAEAELATEEEVAEKITDETGYTPKV